MFDDILIEETELNKIVICPTCGTVIYKIEHNLEDDWEMEKWDYECKQCIEKTIHCAGECGKTVKLASKEQVETTTWTCTECVDKRYD